MNNETAKKWAVAIVLIKNVFTILLALVIGFLAITAIAALIKYLIGG